MLNGIFPLAADGGGNLFVQLLDGRVGIWNREESEVEDHTLFASLDECLWVLLRFEAFLDDRLAVAVLQDALASVANDTGPAYYKNSLENWLADP